MNELLCEILYKCVEISKKTKADVFFEFSPHCNAYSVYWYPDGWTDSTAGDMVFLDCVTGITKENIRRTFAELHDIAEEMGVL